MSFNPYAPPVPVSYGPGGITPSPNFVYRSAAGLVLWVTIGICCMMLADGLITATSVVSDLAFPGLLDRQDLSMDEAVTVMTLGLCMAVGGFGILAAYILSVVMFCMTVNRFNKNARALGTKGMEYTPGWAVGWFFIPIANLFMPYKTVTEIYRASEPQAGEFDWRTSAVKAPIGWWWAAWIISNILDNIEARISFQSVAVPVEVTLPLSLASFALTVVSGVLAIIVVRSILARQEAKAAIRDSKPPVVPQGFGDAFR